MPLAQMLLSFEGRIRRRDYWLCAIGLWLLGSVVTSVLGAAFVPPIFMTSAFGPGYGYQVYWSQWAHVAPVYGLVNLVLLWPRLAIGVKRFHDRDKSGWWLLLVLLPVIGWVWLFIELGFLDGTPGPNKYGPSPKGIGAEATPAPAT